MSKKMFPGKITFDPKTQAGYQSRKRAFSFNSLFGDWQFGLTGNPSLPKSEEEKDTGASMLPQGLQTLTDDRTLPSRRRNWRK